MSAPVHTLELGLVGNGGVAALVDAAGEIVWACMPRPDSDPVFCSLLRPHADDGGWGYFAVQLADLAHTEQEYVANTPILTTRLYDRRGGAIEITDHAPRFLQFGRMFCPMTLVRQVRCLAGSPRITLRLRPATDYGAAAARTTFGTNHVRYECSDVVLRVTTNGSISALIEGISFVLQGTVAFVIGPDETLQGAVLEVARRFFEETADYWRNWVRDLSIPYEWQDEIIRAAISLKLAAVDDTGAVLAAFTTSIPEAPGSGRNWDYRYCWLRDAYFTVNALNRLNATRTLERYLGYIANVAAGTEDGRLQPVYRLNGRREMHERTVATLPGYRGMGPVRVGNQASQQVQNDAYGSAVLAATHVFFDRRLLRPGNEGLYAQLETLGEHAARSWDQPDAGPWELRGATRVHTFSSLMCWAACDRLAKIGAHLGLAGRASFWRARADAIHAAICARAWNARRGSFVASFGGEALDASLLLLAEIGFLRGDDPRFAGTVSAIERELKRGDFIMRYDEPDDFGVPRNAFIVCTYWYIDALAQLGRRAEARALFETLLRLRTRHGLFSEHIDPATHELWGNFPQTYSLVGLVNSATRLSASWQEAF